MKYKVHKSSSFFLLIASLLLMIIIATRGSVIYADRLQNRRLILSTSAPGVVNTHTFEFDIVTTTSIGSLVFEYCSNSPLIDVVCIPSDGLDVNGATLNQQMGEVGFIIDPSTTANRLVLSRTPVVNTPGNVSYVFDGVTNPVQPMSTHYVKISTYSSNDGTGSFIDEGGLAFSTHGGVNINAYVPPYLRFCSGISVGTNCDSVSGSYLSLGNLSPTNTSFGISRLGASTNDPSGYVVYLTGTTMTSGNNVIPPLNTPSASVIGSSQFGINLRANTQPLVGEMPQGLGGGTPTADYNFANQYKFASGDAIAFTNLPTEPNVYTVSYLVNISKSQPSGRYATTVTYIAVAQF